MFQSQISKVAEKLVNLTDERIKVYNKSSGEIVTLEPSSIQLPKEPDDCENPSIMYVVKKKTANRLKRSEGRRLSDIAIIRCKDRGRHNVEITYLVWGNDIHTEVALVATSIITNNL
ncbi:hypothetical protein IKF28_00025 [Candidatus Saccharibacteria bacterium]|nr:hypothetical protein [Candidatus Saccharibacteria bacterium]